MYIYKAVVHKLHYVFHVNVL